MINTTPHDIVIYDESKKNIITSYPSCKDAQIRAMCSELSFMEKLEDGTPVYSSPEWISLSSATAVADESERTSSAPIPEEYLSAEGLIVSSIVAPLILETYQGKIFIPATDPKFVVRDEKGAIIGVTALYRYN